MRPFSDPARNIAPTLEINSARRAAISWKQQCEKYMAALERARAQMEAMSEERKELIESRNAHTARRNAWFHIAMDGQKDSTKERLAAVRKRLEEETNKAKARQEAERAKAKKEGRNPKLLIEDSLFFDDKGVW